MNLSSDSIDLLRALNDANARYLIVGAHAIAYHARPRATADFDVWVDPSPENARRVYKALAAFGAPLDNLTVQELQSDDITDISGVAFDEAWPGRSEDRLGDLKIFVIGREDLIKNKKAAGRRKDLADVERLERDL
jgi:hypothetical protein